VESLFFQKSLDLREIMRESKKRFIDEITLWDFDILLNETYSPKPLSEFRSIPKTFTNANDYHTFFAPLLFMEIQTQFLASRKELHLILNSLNRKSALLCPKELDHLSVKEQSAVPSSILPPPLPTPTVFTYDLKFQDLCRVDQSHIATFACLFSPQRNRRFPFAENDLIFLRRAQLPISSDSPAQFAHSIVIGFVLAIERPHNITLLKVQVIFSRPSVLQSNQGTTSTMKTMPSLSSNPITLTSIGGGLFQPKYYLTETILRENESNFVGGTMWVAATAMKLSTSLREYQGICVSPHGRYGNVILKETNSIVNQPEMTPKEEASCRLLPQNYNSSQKLAIVRCLGMTDRILLLQGPPGEKRICVVNEVILNMYNWFLKLID
jgi:hypothetical protein